MSIPQDVTPSRKRQYLQEALQFLETQPDGAAPRKVFDAVRERLNVSDSEMVPYVSQPGVPRYETIIRFVTLRAVKARWMVKRDGAWYITDEGKAALERFPNSDELGAAAAREYQSWRKSRASGIGPEEISPEELELTGQLPQFSEITLEDAKDRSRQSIRDHVDSLGAFEFQDMIAALLKAMGYHISSKANPGKDWGIDLVAYKDPLGAELPRLKVQVKHTENQIGRPEIQKFVGAIGHDDIGIFVSLGGFSSDARDAVRSHATAKVTLIDFDDLLTLWTRFYERIEETDKRFLRLEPVYFLAPLE